MQPITVIYLLLSGQFNVLVKKRLFSLGNYFKEQVLSVSFYIRQCIFITIYQLLASDLKQTLKKLIEIANTKTRLKLMNDFTRNVKKELRRKQEEVYQETKRQQVAILIA